MLELQQTNEKSLVEMEKEKKNQKLAFESVKEEVKLYKLKYDEEVRGIRGHLEECEMFVRLLRGETQTMVNHLQVEVGKEEDGELRRRSVTVE